LRLTAKGKEYSLAFIQELANEFQASKKVLAKVLQEAGETDGRLWATEFSTREQVDRLRANLTDLNRRQFFIGNSRQCDPAWTPAHEFTGIVLGDAYPVDAESDEMISDCEEFRQFWQPFLAEPIEQVMADLQRLDCCCKYKIQQQDYILGFVDGALGLSGRMRRRMNIADPILATRSSNDNREDS
jgi:hypothetical protein